MANRVLDPFNTKVYNKDQSRHPAYVYQPDFNTANPGFSTVHDWYGGGGRSYVYNNISRQFMTPSFDTGWSKNEALRGKPVGDNFPIKPTIITTVKIPGTPKAWLKSKGINVEKTVRITKVTKGKMTVVQAGKTATIDIPKSYRPTLREVMNRMSGGIFGPGGDPLFGGYNPSRLFGGNTQRGVTPGSHGSYYTGALGAPAYSGGTITSYGGQAQYGVAP